MPGVTGIMAPVLSLHTLGDSAVALGRQWTPKFFKNPPTILKILLKFSEFSFALHPS